MKDLLNQAIEQAVRLYDQKVGEGDLTTETLWPYPRHTEAEIRVNETLPWFSFPILDAVMKHGDDSLTIRLNSEIQSPFSSGDTAVYLEGNGRAIVTGWRVAGSLISFLSSIQREIQKVVDELKSNRIEVTHNLDLPGGYDKLIRYAVEEGGGISLGATLDEIVYLSLDHIAWVGSLSEAIARTIEEVGHKRSLIKVVVELANPEEVTHMMDVNADMVYCKNFSIRDIQQTGELTQGWVKLMVDESIPLNKVKGLRDMGVRMYMVNVSQYFTSKELFKIQFKE